MAHPCSGIKTAFSALPEPIQAYVVQSQALPEAWFEQTQDLIEPLRPVYAGDAEPITTNRTRGLALS